MADRSIPALVRKAPGYVRKAVRRWAVRRWRARYFRRRPDHRALARREAAERVRHGSVVLFLCWGNVCRSPLAARYLRAELADRGVEDVTVRSAGLGRHEGRPSPSSAVSAADRLGVDLSDHRSDRVGERVVEESDVIFVMDYTDYHSLVTRYPDAADRTFFLRPLADGEATIPDPHGTGPARFEEVYATIADALDAVLETLQERDACGPRSGER